MTMAKLAPSAFTWAQLTLPCQPDISHPCGLDLLSRFEGLALTRLRIDAKMMNEHFMTKNLGKIREFRRLLLVCEIEGLVSGGKELGMRLKVRAEVLRWIVENCFSEIYEFDDRKRADFCGLLIILF